MRLAGNRALLPLTALLAVACVPRANFVFPEEKAKTTIFVFMPGPDNTTDRVVLVRTEAETDDVAFTFHKGSFEIYALLYDCGVDILDLHPGLQSGMGDSQPLPRGVWKVLTSTLKDLQHSAWSEADPAEVMPKLADVRVEGLPQCPVREAEHYEIPGTAVPGLRPVAFAMGDGSVLVGLEDHEFRTVSSTGGVHRFEVPPSLPALAGIKIEDEFVLLGTGGRVVRGTFERGFEPLPSLSDARLRTAAITGRRSPQGIDLFAITDSAAFWVLTEGASDWTRHRMHEPGRVFGADIAILNDEVFANVQVAEMAHFKGSYSEISTCGPFDCDDVMSMTQDSIEPIVVGTTRGRLLEIRESAFRELDGEGGPEVTALYRFDDHLVLGLGDGTIRVRLPDGRRCTVPGTEGPDGRVVSEIVPFVGGFVAVEKDVTEGTAVHSTSVAFDVVRVLQCGAESM